MVSATGAGNDRTTSARDRGFPARQAPAGEVRGECINGGARVTQVGRRIR